MVAGVVLVVAPVVAGRADGLAVVVAEAARHTHRAVAHPTASQNSLQRDAGLY